MAEIKEEDKAMEGSASSTNKHSIKLQVRSSMFPIIKGRRGLLQQKIEEEMRIRIKFQSSREDQSIIIEGTSPDSVLRASKRIQFIISEADKSAALEYTHFISLPLAIYPQLVEKLVSFQNSMLKVTNLSEMGIDKSIFINPKTLHLTVLMLKLWNKERFNAAVKIFEGIKGEVMNALNGQPVSIKLKGLACMSGSLDKARVLYAPVEEVGGQHRLLQACEVIIGAFAKSGLVLEKDPERALKLHATVMNAKYRKRTQYTRNLNSFDARGVVEKFGSKEWGEYLIHEVHLSERFKYDKDGYYNCSASFSLPRRMHE